MKSQEMNMEEKMAPNKIIQEKLMSWQKKNTEIGKSLDELVNLLLGFPKCVCL